MNTDFYAVLGLSPGATNKEIRARYRALAREHHPNRWIALRNTYAASGEPDLLEVLDGRIRQAQESFLGIQEAYDVLADSRRRREYDGQYRARFAPAQIVVTPQTLNLGTIEGDEVLTRSFTVENRGGATGAISIDWESDPAWGSLTIIPHAEDTFPIVVKVTVDAEKAEPGRHERAILIVTDGSAVRVVVAFAVRDRSEPSVDPSPANSSRRRSLTIGEALIFVMMGISALVFLGFSCWGVIAFLNDLNDEQQGSQRVASEALATFVRTGQQSGIEIGPDVCDHGYEQCLAQIYAIYELTNASPNLFLRVWWASDIEQQNCRDLDQAINVYRVLGSMESVTLSCLEQGVPGAYIVKTPCVYVQTTKSWQDGSDEESIREKICATTPP